MLPLVQLMLYWTVNVCRKKWKWELKLLVLHFKYFIVYGKVLKSFFKLFSRIITNYI